jgi:hypothetical protein
VIVRDALTIVPSKEDAEEYLRRGHGAKVVRDAPEIK